jgi:hypothetical protein
MGNNLIEPPVAGGPVGRQSDPPIRLRAVLTGAGLGGLVCAVTPFNNAVSAATPLGGGHFPLAPFCGFLLLLILTAVLSGDGKRKPIFTGTELFVVWLLAALAAGIAFTGLARTFFINLTAPFHYATPGNGWKETLGPLMPESLYIKNPEAVRLLYDGIPDGPQSGWGVVLQQIPWRSWLVPLLYWGGFILVCYAVMFFLVNIFSRQWLHNERIDLPLVEVPRLLSEASTEGALFRFLKNRWFLMGLFLPVFLHLVNGLNFYLPSVPHIPTLIPAGAYFPKFGLFAGFHKLKLMIYPAFVGFAFLAPRRVSFSFWFFFLAGCGVYGLLYVTGYDIPSAALGVTFGPTLTRPDETQMVGAFGVFFLFMIWLARRHLWSVVQSAFGRAPSTVHPTEWLSTAVSFWGFVAGVAVIVYWCSRFGMTMMTAVITVGAFFMVMLVATRAICYGGIPYFTLTAAPLDGLLFFFGPGFFTKAGIFLAASVQKALFMDLRESLMPSLVHAGEPNRRLRDLGKQRFLWGIAATLVIGVVVSFTSMLAVCHRYGVRQLNLDWANRTVTTVYEKVNTLVTAAPTANEWVIGFTVAGAVVMTLLIYSCYRFYWFPFHPVGYLTAYSSAMRILWFCFFLGWAANTLCIRYGGVRLFKKLRFFFIGLIVGDFLMGGVYALVAHFTYGAYLVFPD